MICFLLYWLTSKYSALETKDRLLAPSVLGKSFCAVCVQDGTDLVFGPRLPVGDNALNDA
jgi:hypothetical protein